MTTAPLAESWRMVISGDLWARAVKTCKVCGLLTGHVAGFRRFHDHHNGSGRTDARDGRQDFAATREIEIYDDEALRNSVLIWSICFPTWRKRAWNWAITTLLRTPCRRLRQAYDH